MAVGRRRKLQSSFSNCPPTAKAAPSSQPKQTPMAARPVPIGRYELRFHMGEYFTRAGVALADPPFLDVVPVRFSVAEPEAHYHVPLLATRSEEHTSELQSRVDI